MESSILTKSPIINDIVACSIASNMGLLSHDTICALALVNKNLNIAIEQSAEQRRSYFATQTECENFFKNTTLNKRITWHKYNSAFTYWADCTAIVDEREEKQITLHLIHLEDNHTVSHHILECLPTADCRSNSLIFENYKPFFNSKGHACFHTQGQFDLHKGMECSALFSPSYRYYIFEYSINTKGLTKYLPCYVSFIQNTTTSTQSLANLAEYYGRNPQLLKDIINATPSIEVSPETYNVKIYTKYDKPYTGNIKVYNYNSTEKTSKVPAIDDKDASAQIVIPVQKTIEREKPLSLSGAEKEVQRLSPLVDNAISYRERSFIIAQYLRATDTLGITWEVLSNQQRFEKKTLLHSAVITNNLPAVKLILASAHKFNKASELILLKDEIGKTPLDYAIQYRHFPDRRQENMCETIQSYLPQ